MLAPCTANIAADNMVPNHHDIRELDEEFPHDFADVNYRISFSNESEEMLTLSSFLVEQNFPYFLTFSAKSNNFGMNFPYPY